MTAFNAIESYRYQSGRCQAFLGNSSSNDISLPFKLYHVGDIFYSPYALLQFTAHIRTETHCEVYALKNVEWGLTYEAKIYSLRDIHPKLRKRRVENLKKSTDSDSFLYSFDFSYRKVCIFLPSDQATNVSQCILGAIGRRNTPEYNAAFPPLPKTSFLSPTAPSGPIESVTVKKKAEPSVLSTPGKTVSPVGIELSDNRL